MRPFRVNDSVGVRPFRVNDSVEVRPFRVNDSVEVRPFDESMELLISFLSDSTATACTSVDGEWYLTSDYRIKCYENAWMQYVVVASFGILVYPIGRC